VVNSLSLALLLALAGVLYASWKGMGQAALWPSGSRQEPALAAREVRAGLYETARGKPVLCIRGRVEARSATGGPVKVLVDVVRGGRTVARVEALAGAVPTPEEVWLLDGAASAEKLRAALAPRAAPRLGQGESQPFLAVLWDFPEELRGLDLRVVAEPAPAG
jgi:Meckel syndrome type 1 protein